MTDTYYHSGTTNACHNKPRPTMGELVTSKQFPENSWKYKNTVACQYSIEHGKKDSGCHLCKWNQAETAARRLEAVKASKFSINA